MSKYSGLRPCYTVRAFIKAGFWVLGNSDHVAMINDERILIIPRVNPLNSETIEGLIEDSGLTEEEFSALL